MPASTIPGERGYSGIPGMNDTTIPTAVSTSGEEKPNRALTPATATATRTSATSGTWSVTPALSHRTGGYAPRVSCNQRLHDEEPVQLRRAQEPQVPRRHAGEHDGPACPP